MNALTRRYRNNLLAHRLKVPLHPIHSDRHAIDQRERLRMFGENRREVSRERHVRAPLSTVFAVRRLALPFALDNDVSIVPIPAACRRAVRSSGNLQYLFILEIRQ